MITKPMKPQTNGQELIPLPDLKPLPSLMPGEPVEIDGPDLTAQLDGHMIVLRQGDREVWLSNETLINLEAFAVRIGWRCM